MDEALAPRDRGGDAAVQAPGRIDRPERVRRHGDEVGDAVDEVGDVRPHPSTTCACRAGSGVSPRRPGVGEIHHRHRLAAEIEEGREPRPAGRRPEQVGQGQDLAHGRAGQRAGRARHVQEEVGAVGGGRGEGQRGSGAREVGREGQVEIGRGAGRRNFARAGRERNLPERTGFLRGTGREARSPILHVPYPASLSR